MADLINTDSVETQTSLIQWRQRLEREYSLPELKALCLRLDVDAESLHHETKPDLSLDLVKYLKRRGRLADLEREHETYRASRRDTLAAYRNRLIDETEFIELKGIPLPSWRDGRINEPQLLMEEFYIQLQVVAEGEKLRQETEERKALEAKIREDVDRTSSGRSLNFLASLHTLGKYFYCQEQRYRTAQGPQLVDPQNALANHKRLVLLGAPGSGKSTLLRFLARQAAKDEQAPIPILVSLRDFENLFTKNQNLRDFALDTASAGSDELHLALKAKVEKGQVLWLLDALDETQKLTYEVTRLVNGLPGQLVLTSRPVGYSRGALRSLPHFDLLPLTVEKVDRFLRQWMEIISKGQNDIEDVEQRVAALQTQLSQRPQLKVLTRNPLLLTFMVTLVTQSKAVDLPQQRADLYDRYIKGLLDREIGRQQQASSDLIYVFKLGSLTGGAARRAAAEGLTYLGWALHLNYYGGRGEEPPGQDAMKRQLAGYLDRAGTSDAETLAKEIIAFWQTAGMLDKWQLEGHEYLAFRHLTFQEYGAAWGLRRAWQQDGDRAWRFLKPRLHHPSWREPLLLWSSLITEMELTQLLMRLNLMTGWLRRGVSQDESILHRDLRLAAAMLGESQRVDENVAQRVAKRLAWLGRSHHREQSLWSSLVMGFSFGFPLVLFLSWYVFESATVIIWGMFSWVVICLFLAPIFPRLQTLLGLPLHFRVLTPTPFLSAYDALKAMRYRSHTIPYLTAALQDENSSARQKAVEILGYIGDGAIIPDILIALNKHRDMGESAVNALSNLGDVAVPHLVTALCDKQWYVREAAARALGQIGNTASVPQLIAVLQDESESVRWAAMEALSQIGEAVVPFLLATLQDENKQVHGAKFQILVRIGKTAVPHLLTALLAENESVRRLAAWALGEIGDAATVPHLLNILQDENEDVRRVTVLTLGQIGDLSVVPHLIAILQDKNDGVRQAGAWALGQLKDKAAVPYLRAALEDENEDFRHKAAVALGLIGDKMAVPHLLNALHDENKNVRQIAALTLGQIGDTSYLLPLNTALQDEEEDVRQAATLAMGHIGEAAMPHLIAALKNDQESVRRLAAQALGQIGNMVAVPHLLEALQNEDSDIRWAAANALGRMGDAGVSALLTALRNKKRGVQWVAAEVLGQKGHSVVPELCTFLHDKQSHIREAVAKVLGNLGDANAVPHLVGALQDKNLDVRQAAAEALAKNITISINDLSRLKVIRRALKLFAIDINQTAGNAFERAAHSALEQVASRITELSVAQMPLTDPLGLPPPLQPVHRRMR